MSIYRELAYDRVISGIKGIQFCILSEQDMRRRSVVEVTENQTFMGNEPVQNGLFDLRMGVVDGTRVCATCQQRNTFCPGHFGHIVLARPVFYVQFFDVVRKLMKCTCFRCSRILVDLDGPEARRILGRKISRQKRWDAMSKLCSKVKRCGADTVDGCGAKVPDKVVKTEDMRLKFVWKDADGGGGASNGAGREIVFNAEDVLRVLRRMSDIDCEALGFSAEHNRPERMICTVLPVPPPAVRPSVRHETGQRQEDDLTHKLSDIIKRNNIIKDCIARGTTTNHTIETMHVPLLQYHVATLIDNSITTMYQAKDRAGRAFRSLTERLKHKEGRIRGNLMGKRVDFSARTVITPDPNISIDELGVPLKIAMNLTFPEVVGPTTRAELQRLVLAGPDVYPGAKQVRKAAEGNRTIRLRGHPDPASIVLDDGDVVERHLLNGDWVLFNRQPSLHKMSMMAHRVRVMPYNTFRLNVMACSSYNADFDGDEMNMHVPQSLQTQYELKELAAVPLHVLSPRYSRPIIGPVQDVALGVFRITQPDVSVSQRQLYNLSCGNQLLGGFITTSAGRSGVVGGGSRWTGREVLSTVLPPTANIRMKTEDDPSKFEADIHDIRVVDGIIKSGVLSEKVFSKASTGLVHSTYNTLGPDAVIAMLNSTQKLICDWLVLSGFSVGVSDMVIKKETVDAKHVKIAKAKLDVLELMRKVHAGTFENNSTKTDAEMLEDKIGGILSGVATEAYKMCRGEFNIGNNRLLNMIESGSKGKSVNFQQMTACLGPQSIEGRRVTDGFNGRTLPHFTKYDDGPEARGFVEHSFIEGLTPHEFFFHSMAGRIGLIDTAVRTSETGYMQRRLVKAMEDCKIAHDLTVRNANNFIIQFLYGEDGMDAIKLEYHDMKHVLGREPSEIRNDFLLSDSESDLKGFVTPEVLEKMKKDEAEYRQRGAEHFKKILEDRRQIISGFYRGLQENLPIVYPVNVLRLVEQAESLHVKKIATSSSGNLSDLDPISILDMIDTLSKELVVGGAASVEDTKGVRWMPVILRVFLSPKQILRKHHLNRAAFDRVVGEIRRDFYGAVAHPGEQCGVLSAQSIGEPLSQMILNSVVFDTELMLREKTGTLKRQAIGELIENAIEKASTERLEKHPNDTTLVWLKDGGDEGPIHSGLEVLSTDEDGRVMWKEVTAVTRHPVVNKDGSDTLIEVTTESGRSVTATKGKSFLTRRHNKLVATEGEDLKVGDYLPVTRTLKIEDEDAMDYLEVDTYLPRTEFLYHTELAKAIECSKKSRNWYKGPPGSKNVGNGYDFIVPHQRSDSLLVCVDHNIKAPPERQFRQGCVYPKQQGAKSRGHFPERIQLDEMFGFYIGAYLAEGSEGNMQVSDIDDRKRRRIKYVHFCDQIHISNIDKDYQQRIIEFSERYEFGWHLADNTRLTGKSEDICIHSKVISELTVRMCGRGAPNKRIPPELIGANKEFLKGLIDGYFSGDGSCGGHTYVVYASSVSRGLVEDIANILLRFDIGCSFRTQINKLTHTEKGSPIYPCHNIYVRNGDALRFAETFTLSKKAKQTKLEEMKSVVMMNPSYHTPEDIIPSIDLPGSGTTIDVTHRDSLPDLRYGLSNDDDRRAIDMAIAEEVWYDKIVSIKEVPNPKGPYVYDLTVRDTRTFVIWNGMSGNDTFHTSGIGGGAAQVTRGVPRMKEIMSMSKNIKTPSMRIRLHREWATNQERTQSVLSTLETTHFRDVVKRSSIHFDRSDSDTRIKEDEGLMAFYRDFAGTKSSNASCPWVLRFEFDRMKMLNLQVTMLDLEYALVDHFDDAVVAVLSDDNAEHLVCRLRLNAMADLDESTDLLTEMKAMEQAVMDQLVIKGIKGVHKAVPQKPSSGLKKYDPVSDAYVMDDEWYIETAGTNLMEVLCHPCVDHTRTITNDVHEIYLVLGIEAARQAVIDEMRAVLDSTPIDHRHLSLLADTMSNRGFFMSIDRHGINNRGELGPLAKCSFEQSTDMLIKAGMFSERDKVNGVSANIMLGQVAPCGTGDCQVFMDNERLATLGTPVSLQARGRKTAQGTNEQPELSTIVELPELEARDVDEVAKAKDGPRRKKAATIEIV